MRNNNMIFKNKKGGVNKKFPVPFFKNKKGDVAITLLVVMILVLTGATLFRFAKDASKREAYVVNPNHIDEVYVSEYKMRFYLSQATEDAFSEAYDETAASFAGGFGGFNEGGTNKKLSDGLKSRVQSKIQRYPFAGTLFGDFANQIASGKFEASVEGDAIKVSADLKNFVLTTNLVNGKNIVAEVSYNPAMKLIFSCHDRFGLEDFKKISDASVLCKPASEVCNACASSDCVQCQKDGSNGATCQACEKAEQEEESAKLDTIKSCISGRLTNFDVSVSKDKGGYKATLTSKRTFVVAGTSRKISMTFPL